MATQIKKGSWEFKVLRGADSDVQKTLNQWKHEYTLRIHSFENAGEDKVVVLLVRIRK